MIRRLSTLVLFTLILAAGLAQASIVLSPPVQEIPVYRGKQATFTITAINDGDETEAIQFLIKNMDITEEGRPFASDSTYDRGCAEWITLDPREAVVEPMQRVEITGTIDAPRGASGSYYAMFLVNVSEQQLDLEDGGAGFKILSQAGTVLMPVVQSGRNEAILNPDTLIVYPNGEEAELQNNVLAETAGWEVVLGIRNDGEVHTTAHGDFTLWSSAGVRLETVSLESGQGYILPGRTRNFRASGGGALTDGYYLMSFNLRTREGRTITENLPFSIRENEVFFNETAEGTEALLKAAMPRFRLREKILQRNLSPGGDSYLAINLQNVSTDTINLHPELLEWFIDPAGYSKFSDVEPPHNRSCIDWIEMIDADIVLLPKRSTSVKAKVHTPEDATEGEFYGAITFVPEGVDPELLDKFRSIRTQQIILKGPEEGKVSVSVDSVYIKTHMDGDETVCDFSFLVHNTGTKYCYADGNLVIDKEVAPGVYELFTDLPEFGGRDAVIMPNSDRAFSLSFPGIPPGKYRALVRVVYDTEQPTYLKARVFTL
ncbi:hypothetical protein KQI52_15000 [bacterium]|nr:hypothetical protein [bacterium]